VGGEGIQLTYTTSSPALTASDIYKSVVPLHDLLVDIEELNGFSLCWIGSRTAKSIILYACGTYILYFNHFPFRRDSKHP